MPADIVENVKKIQSEMDQVIESINTTLEPVYLYQSQLAGPLDDILRELRIKSPKFTLSFAVRWFHDFKDHKDWYGLDIAEYDGDRHVVIHRNGSANGHCDDDDDWNHYTMEIPASLLIDPVCYIRNMKTKMYCFIMDTINEYKKEAYKCQVMIDTIVNYKDSTMADEDLSIAMHNINELESFLKKI